jgi:hypothetical protein
MKNAELIQGLRDLLAFVESNDDFEFTPGDFAPAVELNYPTWYLSKPADRAPVVAELTRRLVRFGKVEKQYSNDFAWIRLNFGQQVRFSISTMRETICERVVVGRKVIPAQAEVVIPAKPETTVDEVEWRCHPVLTAGTSHTIEGEAPQLEADEPFQLSTTL